MNYCIYGNESLRVKEKIKSITKQWLKEESDLNMTVYDAAANDFSVSAVLEDCWTIPFLSEVKVILVRNAGFLSTAAALPEADQNRLLDYFKSSCKETVLILSGDFEKMDSRKKLVKAMNKLVECIQCNHMETPQFHAYVRQACQKNHLNLDKMAMDELLSRLLPDLQNFQNVLAKLMLYPEPLDQKSIAKLVARPLEDNVFELVDAVVQSDLKKAMHLWRDLQVINTDPIGLVSLIGNQFRLLYQIKTLHEQGQSEASMASLLKIHPYRIKLGQQSCRRITHQRLGKLITLSADLDQRFKMGTVERTLGFENFLIAATKG